MVDDGVPKSDFRGNVQIRWEMQREAPKKQETRRNKWGNQQIPKIFALRGYYALLIDL